MGERYCGVVRNEHGRAGIDRQAGVCPSEYVPEFRAKGVKGKSNVDFSWRGQILRTIYPFIEICQE